MARCFAPAVIIGLGGTGQHALIHIKKHFLDQCGLVPPCIKLLAFDTTPDRETASTATGAPVRLDDSEFCHMSVRSIADAIQSPYVETWWTPYETLNRSSVSDGAGGIRQVGRLATFANIDKVVHILRRSFEQLHAAGMKDEMLEANLELLETGTPQVFVVTSLAGGTGSGAFVDFSILCRSLGGQNMFYTAFFVMPWVFRDVAKTGFENGYAALLELEKLNAASEDSPYRVAYTSSLNYKLEEPPYHIINLIDGQCRNRHWILSRTEIPAFVGESIVTSIGGVARKYRQITDNVRTMIHLALAQPEKWEDQQALYSTTGVSAIVYPAQQIHARLKSQYAIGLIDQLLPLITQQQVSGEAGKHAPAKVVDAVRSFLGEKNLTVDGDAILHTIQEIRPIAYHFDDDQLGLNLRDPNLATALESPLGDWQQSVESEHPNRLSKVQDEVKTAVDKWLNTIRKYEQEKREGFPEGSYLAACQLLSSHWEKATKRYTGVREQLQKEKAGLDRTVDMKRNEIGQRIPTHRWASTNSVRNACAQYCKSVAERLEHKLLTERLRQAIELCNVLKELSLEYQRTVEVTSEASQTVVSELQELELDLASVVARLSAKNILEQKTQLELVVGVEVTTGPSGEPVDTFVVRDTKVAASDVAKFRGTNALTHVAASDVAKFRETNELSDMRRFIEHSKQDREKMILDFAEECVRPATDLTVVQVLKGLNDQDPSTIDTVVERAVRFSSQMLPIDENKLTGRSDIITEFAAVGGVFDDVAIEQAILARLPQSHIDAVQTFTADTGDPHRLTFANYFSVIPLYVLTGIKDARDLYLQRVRPPSHTDRMFEFPLVDILPGSAVQMDVLKILALSLLQSTDVIQRVSLERPIGTSHSYYRLNQELFPVVDDSELRLPGTPGKFYALYEELCRPAQESLRKRLRNALVRVSQTRGSSQEAVLGEIRENYDQFKETLGEKKFNRAVTGTLYRQQMVYFHKLLGMEPKDFSIEKALNLPLSFRDKMK